MVKRLRIGEKEYELEKDMSCEEVKGLSEFLYIDNLKEEVKQLKQENEKLRRLFEEIKQPITINLTEEDKKELRKLLGLVDDE